MIPGKRRCIGRAIPGAERWERLVNERYCLATLPDGIDPSGLVDRLLKWGSADAYARWLGAYRRNEGNFLDHPVWGADRDLGGGVLLHGAMDDRYATNLERVVRGGSWRSDAKGVRATTRGGRKPDAASPTVGFRVVREFSFPEGSSDEAHHADSH